MVIGGAVVCMGLAVLANFFDIKPIVYVQNVIGVILATAKMVEMLVSFVKLLKFAVQFRSAGIIAAEFSAAVKGAEGITKAGVVA